MSLIPSWIPTTWNVHGRRRADASDQRGRRWSCRHKQEGRRARVRIRAWCETGRGHTTTSSIGKWIPGGSNQRCSGRWKSACNRPLGAPLSATLPRRTLSGLNPSRIGRLCISDSQPRGAIFGRRGRRLLLFPLNRCAHGMSTHKNFKNFQARHREQHHKEQNALPATSSCLEIINHGFIEKGEIRT